MECEIGTFQLGMRAVTVYVDDTVDGGQFRIQEGHAEIRVGKSKGWQQIAWLLHEATELAYCDMGLCFSPECNFANATDVYHFFMTHFQFQEATARVGYFMSQAVDQL